MLLGPDNVDLFAVVECLTDEGNVLQTEQRDVPPHDLCGTAECVLRLPVESTLSKDRAEKAAILQEGLDVIDDLGLGLCGRADDHDVRSGDNLARHAGAFVDPACHLTLMFPGGLGSVGNNGAVEDFRAPRENVNLPRGIVVADNGD